MRGNSIGNPQSAAGNGKNPASNTLLRGNSIGNPQSAVGNGKYPASNTLLRGNRIQPKAISLKLKANTTLAFRLSAFALMPFTSTFDIRYSAFLPPRAGGFTGNFSGFTDLCHSLVGLRLPGEPARDSFV
jgi:hypothetical protein